MKIQPSVLLLLLVGSLCAAELPSEQARLAATGKLWITVKYFHPFLAYRSDIDWDKALVDALPQIRGAKTTDQYAAAIQGMMHRLSPRTPNSTQPASAHRTWIHYGPNRSAFAIEPGPPAEAIAIDMGGGLHTDVQLSEPFTPEMSSAPTPQPDHSYADSPYPSTEYRILAAYKIWGIIRTFFAYRDLMDDDWDDDFAAFLPSFISAKNAQEYNLAVSEAILHLDDSNAVVSSHELDQYFGPASPGLRLRLIEKKPLITEIFDDQIRSAGVQVGDIVTRVDDEDIVARIKRESGFLSASTDQALGNSVMQRILNGPGDSLAALTIRTHDGATKEIQVKRQFTRLPEPARKGEAVQLLSTRVGYLNLSLINADQLDAALEKLASTSALIFDARGPLNFDPALLASRVTAKSDVAGAIVSSPIALKPDFATPQLLTQTASSFRVEAVPLSSRPTYQGRTSMLIDERTTGPAEHLGLLLEAANHTTFIGSSSAGADSEVAAFSVPGGITITFSASDVRHANGGKLQRLGLEPAITVFPTLADIRAGRDVVLDKAVEDASGVPAKNLALAEPRAH